MRNLGAIFAKKAAAPADERTHLLWRHTPAPLPVKPSMWRRMTAPAAIERQEDRYTSLPFMRPRRPTLAHRVTDAFRRAEDVACQGVQGALDDVELGTFRMALRSCACWLRCCWRRR